VNLSRFGSVWNKGKIVKMKRNKIKVYKS